MNDFERFSSVNAGDAKKLPSYVLITPARNEAAFIGKTLESLVKQTVYPIKWVIVSDGSTDGTDEIVQKYCDKYEWIELVQLPPRSERDFARKVKAFNEGFRKLENLNYDIIGNVDADTIFDTDHFEFLLEKFLTHPNLGVAGTPYIEETGKGYNYNIVNVEDVSGACQLFRRDCYTEIGGYIAIKDGGEDSVAVFAARAKGWMTQSFTERHFIHSRKLGRGREMLLIYHFFKLGKMDYYLGGHPLWEIFRCLYQMKNKPYVVGGIVILTGYVLTLLKREKRPISSELIAFRKKEQMRRLREIAKSTFSLCRSKIID